MEGRGLAGSCRGVGGVREGNDLSSWAEALLLEFLKHFKGRGHVFGTLARGQDDMISDEIG